MGDWVDIEEAIRSSGLRLVLTPGVPGPYTEAAKGTLFVKKLPYLKAKQEILGANLALKRWTAQTTAPVVAWNDEPPRSTWIEQLALFERLAPEPRLIPADWDERTTMFGLAQEIFGEGGWVWNRRFLQVRDWSTPAQPKVNGFPRGELLRELHCRVGMVFQFHNELSGGEAQRVAIARALAVDPPLLLMDEPTASLDGARRTELAATLKTLVTHGRSLVIATHDVDFARQCAQRVVMLAGGRIGRDGPALEVL